MFKKYASSIINQRPYNLVTGNKVCIVAGISCRMSVVEVLRKCFENAELAALLTTCDAVHSATIRGVREESPRGIRGAAVSWAHSENKPQSPAKRSPWPPQRRGLPAEPLYKTTPCGSAIRSMLPF